MILFVKTSRKFAKWQNEAIFRRIGATSAQAASFRSSTISQAIVSGTRFPELGGFIKKSYHTGASVMALNTPMSHVIIESSPHFSNIESEPMIKPVTLFNQRSLDWYTGKAPVHGACPGVEKDGRIYSLPQLTFPHGKTTKKALQDYFDNTWTLTEALLGCLQGEEAFHVPPYHDLRHPMIFYYGHPAALYINKLRVAGLLTEPINPYFEVVFETGVDEMSWDDLSKNKMPWPSVDEVRQYRAQVYQKVSSVISNLSDHQLSTLTMESPLWSLVMAFEHERIHIETSSVLINELPLKYVQLNQSMPKYHSSIPSVTQDRPVAGTHYPLNKMIPIAAKSVTLGKPASYPSFGWDNEYGQRQYQVNDFRASQYKVSNGEFFEFVSDGGYAKREHWTDVGWEWRAFRNVKHPTFWVRRGPQGNHQYDLRLLCDVVPMPWDWPAAVNLHEAEAFTRWKRSKDPSKNYRILSELEHHAIRDDPPGAVAYQQGQANKNDHSTHFSGYQMLDKGVNTNLSCSSMSPVNALPPTKQGFYDVFGNAWEWTLDKFCALPGFEVHQFYEDFSTPCFDGLHYVIQGGSFISTGQEASVFARYHFRPHFYQHSSFRLVEQPADQLVTSDTDAPGPYVGNYPFRRSSEAVLKLMAQQQQHGGSGVGTSRTSLLSRHFGSAVTATAGSAAPQARVEQLVLHFARQFQLDFPSVNALEVGCGPGGMTFALARAFGSSVIGVDHHAESIDLARQLNDGKALEYSLQGEGELFTTYLADLATHKPLLAKKVEFRQSDPMCLPAEMSGFNVVVLSDVIDKISSPNALLGRLGGVRGLVKKDGLLLVLSCFAWDANTTPKSLWLGGYTDKQGRKVSSQDALVEKLAEDFDLVHSESLPVSWNESQSHATTRVYRAMVFQRK